MPEDVKGQATKDTEWPDLELPKNLAPFLDKFFGILDNDTEDAGQRLVDEIFADDGEFATHSKPFKGRQEILNCCADRWASVKERLHVIDKVYTASKDGSDLLVIGHARQVLRINDIEVTGELIGRITLEKVGTDDMRIKFFKVWGDSGPMLKKLIAAGIPVQ